MPSSPFAVSPSTVRVHEQMVNGLANSKAQMVGAGGVCVVAYQTLWRAEAVQCVGSGPCAVIFRSCPSQQCGVLVVGTSQVNHPILGLKAAVLVLSTL